MQSSNQPKLAEPRSSAADRLWCCLWLGAQQRPRAEEDGCLACFLSASVLNLTHSGNTRPFPKDGDLVRVFIAVKRQHDHYNA